MSDPSDDNILLPDPQDRRRAIILVCVCAVVGVAAIAAAQNHLASIVDQAGVAPELAMERFRTFAMWFSLTGSFGLLAIAVWLRGLAVLMLEEERFPPSTMKVIRPTPVLTGYAARLRARAALLCSFLLILSAFAMPLSLLSIVDAVAAAVR